MVEVIKTFVNGLLELFYGQQKQIVLDSYEFKNKVEDQLENNSHENLSMLIYEDLKRVPLFKGVMSDNFCTLKTTDTLSQALSLSLLRNLDYILLVNNEDKFVCTLDTIEVLRKAPPAESDIPLLYKIENPNTPKEVNDFILDIIKKPIEDVFILDDFSRYSYKPEDRFSRALEELARPYLIKSKPEILPIIDNNNNVIGVVSAKEMLSYIYTSYSENSLIKRNLIDIFEGNHFQSEVYTLTPENTLSDAYLSVEYIPTKAIPVIDCSSNLVGIVDKKRVIGMTHIKYLYLADMPVADFMSPIDDKILVEFDVKLEEIISKLISPGIDFVLLVDKKEVGKSLPLKLINPTNILELFWVNLN